MAPRKKVLMAASGDLRQSANETCWPAQAAMEKQVTDALKAFDVEVERAHPYDPARRHGFIASQKEGLEIFSRIDSDTPIIVAEAVWQYTNHVLPGLIGHRAPILTVANWSGQWPGLVGMLNLNGSLTKAGVPYSTLWSETFTDDLFKKKLHQWLQVGRVTHDLTHVHSFVPAAAPDKARAVAKEVAAGFRHRKAIMGIFDEGCMGMYNALIPDELLFPLGVFKERLSQSALYAASREVSDAEARAVYDWLVKKGMTFHFGMNPETDLTLDQVLGQCRMYIAATRIAESFGCDAIGIQYQQGMKDLMPASDLAEGMLNNDDRPPVKTVDGRLIREAQAIVHFNEVDECAGLDAMFTNRVHRALSQPVETTLHDIRWGDADRSGTTPDYVWVFEISGAAPPAHHIGGWAGTDSLRQPPMYFRLGGGTVRGIAKPGPIVWSRIFVETGRLKMDLGRAHVVELPKTETDRRWNDTTPQWPIMHAVLHGVTRDQLMARHKANHIQVAYASSDADADLALAAKASLAAELGLEVSLCGAKPGGTPLIHWTP
jgi:L-fucose isomerase, C-terminal domain